MRMGLRMKLLRKRKRLSQKQLAAKMLVSPTTVSKYERGIYCPDIDYIARFCKCLNISTDFLLNEDAKLRHVDIEPIYVLFCKIIEMYKRARKENIWNNDNCSKSDSLQALDEECNGFKYEVRKLLETIT